MIDPIFVVGLCALGIVAFVYEISRAARGQSTISEQVWSIEKLWPPILFLAGVLAGHLFTC